MINKVSFNVIILSVELIDLMQIEIVCEIVDLLIDMYLNLIIPKETPKVIYKNIFQRALIQ